jgi:hypothetical protein
MLGMNTLRLLAGGRLFTKEPIETAPDQWPAEIGEQMAAAHRVIYPVANTVADPRLFELLKLVEGLRGSPH